MQNPENQFLGLQEKKVTWIKSVEQGCYEAYTGVICKRLFELVHFS